VSQRVIIDEITVICSGCRGERTVKLAEPLVGAQAVHEWVQQGIPPCQCGATHCDIKMRMVPSN
jgi:hypothetical protein